MNIIERIKACEWLSDERKAEILERLEVIKGEIGFVLGHESNDFLSDCLSDAFYWGDDPADGTGDYWSDLWEEMYAHEDHPEDELD